MYIDAVKNSQADAEAAAKLVMEWQVSLDTLLQEFVKRCSEERKAKRAEITKARRDGDRPSYSSMILTYRMQKGYADLYWSQIYYVKGSKTPRFRRLKMTAAGVNLISVVKDAHPLEVELLRAHEIEARAFRKLWSSYVVARREVGKVVAATTKVAELDTDPMLRASR